MCRNQNLSYGVSGTLSVERRNSACARRTTGDMSTVKGVQRPLAPDLGNRKSGRRCFPGDMTDAMLYTRFRVMIFVLLCMLTGCGGRQQGHSSPEEELNPDIAVLLDKLSAICADRWTIQIGDNNMIRVESNEKALGDIARDSYPAFDQEYTLYFDFKIVNKVTPQEASDRLRRLDDLTEKVEAKGIKGIGGGKMPIRYKPHGQDQWALVLRLRKAKEKVEDVPEHRYESVYLSEEYSTTPFHPNEKNNRSLQYEKDIDDIYDLFVEP